MMSDQKITNDIYHFLDIALTTYQDHLAELKDSDSIHYNYCKNMIEKIKKYMDDIDNKKILILKGSE